MFHPAPGEKLPELSLRKDISSSLFEKNVSEPDFEQTSCAVSKFAASTFSSHQFMQTSVKHTIVILI